jgi:polysaccharide pyruvyl transferase WcaK-like protein
LKHSGRKDISVRPLLTLKDLLLQMSTFDYVVTSRFHGVIFSQLLAKPVIALSYLPKINHLMRTAGHDRYCMEVGDFQAEELIASFRAAVTDGDRLRSLFRKTSANYAAVLDRHFDEIFLPKAVTRKRGGPAIRETS